MTDLLPVSIALGLAGAALPWLVCRVRALRAWRAARRPLGPARTGLEGTAEEGLVTLRGRLSAAGSIPGLDGGRPELVSTYVLRTGRRRFGRAICRAADRLRLDLGETSVWLVGRLAVRAGARERRQTGRLRRLHAPSEAEQAMLATRGVFRSFATGDLAIVRGVLRRSRFDARVTVPYRSLAAEWSLEPERPGADLVMVSARSPRVAGPGWRAAVVAALALGALGALPAVATGRAHGDSVTTAGRGSHGSPRVFRLEEKGVVTQVTPVAGGLCFLQDRRPACWRNGALATLPDEEERGYDTLAASDDGLTVCAAIRPRGRKTRFVRCWQNGTWDVLHERNGGQVPFTEDDAALYAATNGPEPVPVIPHAWSRDHGVGADTPRGFVAGARHWCSQSNREHVICWGADALGRPAEARSLHVASVQLAATGETTCGRDAKGSVYCWGSSAYGALGNGTASTPPNCMEHGGCEDTRTDPPSARPVMVQGVSDARWLAAGGGRFCALGAGGALRCWGLLVSEDSGGDCRLDENRFGVFERCGYRYEDTAVVVRQEPGADDLRMGAEAVCVHHPGRGWSCWTARLDAPFPGFALGDDGVLDACGQLRIEAARVWQRFAGAADSDEADDLARALIETADWPPIPPLTSIPHDEDPILEYRDAVTRTKLAAWHCGASARQNTSRLPTAP